DVGLRVFVGQRTASISTSQLDPENIKNLAERAVAMAKLAPEDPYVRLATDAEIAKVIPDLDMYDETMPDAESLRQRAAAAEDAALSHKGIKTSDGADAGHSIVDVLIGTSNGFLAGYKRSSHGVSTVVIAEQNGHMERDYDYSAAVYESDLQPADEVGHNAASRTVARLGAKKAKTGKFPVIYDRRVAASLVGTMAGAINGAAIARGTSFLKDRLGKQVTRCKVFIDGEAGTTGLKVAERLQQHPLVQILRVDEAYRKDAAARADIMAASDITILCLPDDAAVEAVTLAQPSQARLIDASSAHRTNPDWVYGFAELQPGQRDAIATARLITNPGCYPTGFLALARPLIASGLVADTALINVPAVSGFSGG
ncbi:MAG: N-acetyl-gamma-glutamyl-phosphate reductase, partial [Alphaproteobacteria bacterium]|nr:N-acetyl-gamma-glutamyl-phosphate reductase [Alphaproteobacteria bacterium]